MWRGFSECEAADQGSGRCFCKGPVFLGFAGLRGNEATPPAAEYTIPQQMGTSRKTFREQADLALRPFANPAEGRQLKIIVLSKHFRHFSAEEARASHPEDGSDLHRFSSAPGTRPTRVATLSSPGSEATG